MPKTDVGNFVYLIEDWNDLEFDIDIPPGWPVYNSSRPLFGDLHWQADFRHGRYYVAIDPSSDTFEHNQKRTLEYDGWRVLRVTRKQVEDFVVEYALANYKKGLFTREKVLAFDYSELVSMFVKYYQPDPDKIFPPEPIPA